MSGVRAPRRELTGLAPSRMGSKSPGNTGQPPAFFSKLTESTSAMVKSKKQEINKKLGTHNRNEPEYSKGAADARGRGRGVPMATCQARRRSGRLCCGHLAAVPPTDGCV